MGKRILVVEDEAGVRALVTRVLTEVGCEVAEAHDGLDAVRLGTATASFDLLLVDQRMPGLLGDEVIRRIRERFPVRHVIRLLGNPDDDRDRPVETPCPPLRKPFKPDDLLAAVAACLGGTHG